MRRALALVCAAAVSTTLLVQTPSARSAPDPDGAEATLKADADGPVRIRREGGVATFVGAPAGTDVDNPSVNRGTTVSASARSHLRRYGAVIGADRPGTTLKETRRERSVAGADVVRFEQEVDGLPVIGGEVVVTLTGDHDLGSLNGNLSPTQDVPSATVTEKEARATAVALVARSAAGQPVADSQGRWLFDPEAVSWPSGTGSRGVWRFEVRAGHDVRRMVLVDDRTGGVLLDVDLIQHVDRVVCDRANASAEDPVPCTSDPARTETSGPSAVIDVEQAFANSGAVSGFYDQIGDRDLTDLIGLVTSTGKKLSSSVRVCVDGEGCPYGNAYWNGQAMFYGQGYAGADDVVGHEMTHGVIERTSGLLYWDQAGAINESLADIIGEIIDHRNPSAGDTAGDWRLGEDLPVGAIRDLSDPPAFNQPDRTNSPLWRDDTSYTDSGGVHRNSGVGNKAFYLISQGSDIPGQAITGIDAGDPTLAKSAVLWLQVIDTITAFTEYADLAVVLGQACSALVGTHGFTSADCTSVSKAITATEMTVDPVSDPVTDADRTCPTGFAKQVLFDSETGADQAGKFTAGVGWGRLPGTAVNEAYGVNAYSGSTSWVAEDPSSTATRSLTGVPAIALPSGQSAYLAFRHWYLFDFETEDATPNYYDGGTVEVDDVDDPAGPVNVSGRPWVHGPTRTLQSPNAGRKAFSGSSRGWVGSRVDLTGLAGHDIRPVFTVRTDSTVGYVGWYLDDIEIYTCAEILVQQPPTIIAGPGVGDPFDVVYPGTWTPAGLQFTYQWLRNGSPIVGATSASYRAVVADLGTVLSVQVTGAGGGGSVMTEAVFDGPVVPGILGSTRPFAQGAARVGYTMTATRGFWTPSGITFKYQWLRDGKAIKGATGKTRKLTRWDRGHRLQVRVTGSKPGYTTVVRTSAHTPKIR
ncbi:MAG: M4 family metallopeptidase [Propionibacteriales bacterium]|nr:M4 family metallopeptidase [Propionibacteriales bacterium]